MANDVELRRKKIATGVGAALVGTSLVVVTPLVFAAVAAVATAGGCCCR